MGSLRRSEMRPKLYALRFLQAPAGQERWGEVATGFSNAGPCAGFDWRYLPVFPPWEDNLCRPSSRPGPVLGKTNETGNGTAVLETWPIQIVALRSGKPAMEFIDRVLKCIDCGEEFVFTAGEQLFFHDKQFKNDPKRCKQCKAKRANGGPRVRTETRTKCSACGEDTTVPFRPTQGRPVLCRSCFQKVQAVPPAAPPPGATAGPG